MRSDAVPGGVGFGGKQFIHGGSLQFAGATAHIGSYNFGREVLRRTMQPTRQDGAVGELSRVLCQCQEYSLGDVLGQVRVANHPYRGGMNEIDVAPHQFGESRFAAAFGVVAQELLVGQTVHSLDSTLHCSNRT